MARYPPWLFAVLIRIARDAIKRQAIRQRHESEAAKMRPTTTPDPQADWNSIAPNLEEAVARLRFGDQQAILLRFYEQLSFAEVAEMLGITEEAARKRVSRATEKLLANLGPDGSSLSALSLATMLVSHATASAPSNLVASALSASLLSANTTVSALVNSAKAIMFWEKIKVSCVVALAAAVIAVGAATVISQVAAPTPAASTARAAPQRATFSASTAPASMQAAVAISQSVRGALARNAEQMNQITVAWSERSSSPLTVQEAAKALHVDEQMANYFINGRRNMLVMYQGGQYVTLLAEKPGDSVSEASFDGQKFVSASHNPDKPWNVLETPLSYYGDEEAESRYLNTQYFDMAGLPLSVRVKDLKQHRPAQSQILLMLDEGAVISLVEESENAGHKTIKVQLVADNPERRQAEKTDPAKVAEDLRGSRSSAEYKKQILEAIQLRRNLPEKRLYTFYLDPEFNCAVRRAEESYPGDILLQRIDCDDFEKIPGREVFLPRKCVLSSFNGYVNIGVYFKDPVLMKTYEVTQINADPIQREQFQLRHVFIPGSTVTVNGEPNSKQTQYVIEEDGSRRLLN